MRVTATPRCPSCWLPLRQSRGQPLRPGALIVCAGCASLARFSDDDERLVVLGPGELPTEMAAEAAMAIAAVRETLDGGCRPYGYRWARAAVCGRCWRSLEPDRQPVVVVGLTAEPCGVCGTLTASGICRRMLVPVEDERGACSGCGYSRARCAELEPLAVKCCPDCAHPPVGQAPAGGDRGG